MMRCMTFLLLLVACRPAPLPLQSTNVVSVNVPALRDTALQQDLIQRFEQTLQRKRVMRPCSREAECRRTGWRATLAFEAVDSQVLMVPVKYVLDVSLRRGQEGEPLTVHTQRVAGSSTLLSDLGPLVEAGAEVLAGRIAVHRLSSEAILVSLPESSGQHRFWLVDELAARGEPGAVPALTRLIEEERETDVLLRAVGALIATGESDIGPALIAATEKRVMSPEHFDPGFVIQIIYALGHASCSQARAFLATLAAGHPVSAVRQAAQETLQELEASSK